MTWANLFEHWAAIDNDLAERYGIDLHDDAVMGHRGPDGRWVRGTGTWLWLQTRILGLLSAPPAGVAPNGAPVWGTRLQTILFPPPKAERSAG